MKKLYVRILLFVMLIINSLSMHGMFTTQASRLGQTSTQRAAAARRTAQGALAARPRAVGQRYSSVGSQVGEQVSLVPVPEGNQGWFSWLRLGSASTRPQVAQPVNLDRTDTFSYSDEPVQMIERLTPEQFANEFRSLLSRGIETMYRPESTSPYVYHGIPFPNNISQFDDNDLQQAKMMIDGNRDMLNALTTDTQSGFGPFGMNDYVFFYKLGFLNKVSQKAIELSRQVTILDIVLRKFFGSDNALVDNFTASEGKLKLIELINYLMDAGALINPENKRIYKRAYVNHMMPSFQKLYHGWTSSWFGANKSDQSEKLIMKKIFEEFDPVFKRLMPEFQSQLRNAQKERVKIENSGKRTKEYWRPSEE